MATHDATYSDLVENHSDSETAYRDGDEEHTANLYSTSPMGDGLPGGVRFHQRFNQGQDIP